MPAGPPPLASETHLAGSDRLPPAQRIARILRATVVLVGLAVVLWAAADAALIIFLAIMLGIMLHAFGRGLQRLTKLWLTPSVLIVLVLFFALICALGWWIGPRLVSEARQLWSQLSGPVHEIQSSLHALGFGNVASGSNFISGAAKLVASSTLDLLGALVVIVAVAFYFAIDPSLYLDGIVYLLPVWYRERGRMILLEAGAAVQGWLLGQLIDMLVVGFLVGGGLALLGVPLALVLGVIAGLFTFVPYFGTIISAVPALMVGLTGGPRQMLWVLALFVVAHGIEGYVVAPLVQRRTVHLPPALTLIAMVVLTAVIGISGVLIATPLVAVLLVGVTRVYVEDILGDHVGGARLTVRGWW